MKGFPSMAPVLVVLLLGAGLAGTALETVQAAPAGDTYVALSPWRILDTRTNGETLGAGSTLSLQVAGTRQVPSAATAVAVNVTVTDTTASSFLAVYPTGTALPLVSNLNWTRGDTLANLAIVPVGSGGAITFYNAVGRVDLVVDLQGYFVAGAGPTGEYVPLAPERITDTRSGSGYPNAGAPLGPRSTLDIQVSGEGGIPTEGVAAAVLNVTVTNTTAPSFLSVYPESAVNPGTSSLNWEPGATVANRVVVPVSASGQIRVFNAAGYVNVIVDVSGYFTAGAAPVASASLYYPLAPTRVLDTRVSGDKLQAASYVGEQLAGIGGISDVATAVIANLTTTNTSTSSYFSVSPQESVSGTSDLNWTAGMTVANLDIAVLNPDGDFYLYNALGTADAVIDVFGYFVPVNGGGTSAIQPCSSVNLSTASPTVVEGPVDVSVSATCPPGQPAQYTYWDLAPGSSAWTLAGSSDSSSTFQYSTGGWRTGAYGLLAWASSQPGIFQGVISETTVQFSSNPLSNLPDPFVSTCYNNRYGSVSCMESEIAAIDSARAGEGVVALNWPSSMYSLSPDEQEFVLADEERVGRGLSAISGLTSGASQVATEAAQANEDPDGFGVPGSIAYASNWAEDYGSLGSMFDWMYNDGLGSFNLDCTTANSTGCWIHRDNILLNISSGAMAAPAGYTWVGGTGCTTESGVTYLDACALLWVLVPSSSVTYDFTWADAVAMGA
jgi:hypothetical protein